MPAAEADDSRPVKSSQGPPALVLKTRLLTHVVEFPDRGENKMTD